jgi:chromosome segregation ATPase
VNLQNVSRLVVMRGNKASRSPRKDVTERSLRQPDPKAQEEVQFLVKLLEDAKEERTENVERISELEGSLEVKQQAMQEYLRLTELKSQQQQERVRQRNEMLKSWVEMGTALCYIKKDLPIKDMIEKSCEMNPDAQRSSQEIYRKLSASESSGLPQIGGTSFEALERAMTVQKKDLWDTTPGALLSPMKQSPGKLAGSSSFSSNANWFAADSPGRESSMELGGMPETTATDARNVDSADLRGQVASLREALHASRDAAHNAERALQSVREEFARERDSSARQRAELEGKVEALNTEVASITDVSVKYRRAKSDAEASFEATKRNMDRALSEAKDNEATWKASIAAERAATDRAETQGRQIQAQLDEMRTKMASEVAQKVRPIEEEARMHAARVSNLESHLDSERRARGREEEIQRKEGTRRQEMADALIQRIEQTHREEKEVLNKALLEATTARDHQTTELEEKLWAAKQANAKALRDKETELSLARDDYNRLVMSMESERSGRVNAEAAVSASSRESSAMTDMESKVKRLEEATAEAAKTHRADLDKVHKLVEDEKRGREDDKADARRAVEKAMADDGERLEAMRAKLKRGQMEVEDVRAEAEELKRKLRKEISGKDEHEEMVGQLQGKMQQLRNELASQQARMLELPPTAAPAAPTPAALVVAASPPPQIVSSNVDPAELRQARDEASRKTRECEDLQRQLDGSKSDLVVARSRLEETQGQIPKLEDKLRDVMNSARRAEESAQEKLQEVQTGFKKKLSAAGQLAEEGEDQISRLKRQLKMAQESLETAAAAAAAAAPVYVTPPVAAPVAPAAIQPTAAPTGAGVFDFKPLMETIQAQTKKIEDGALVLLETRADKSALEEKVRFMEGRVVELSSWKHRAEELESALSAARTKIQSDRLTIDSMNKDADKVANDQERELDRLERQISALQGARDAAKADKEEAENALEKTRAVGRDVLAKLKAFELKDAKENGEVLDLRHQLQRQMRRMEDAAANHASLLKEVEAERAESEGKGGSRAAQTIAHLTATLRDYETDIASFDSKLRIAEGSSEQSRKLMEDMQAELLEEKRERILIQRELNDVRDEHAAGVKSPGRKISFSAMHDLPSSPSARRMSIESNHSSPSRRASTSLSDMPGRHSPDRQDSDRARDSDLRNMSPDEHAPFPGVVTRGILKWHREVHSAMLKMFEDDEQWTRRNGGGGSGVMAHAEHAIIKHVLDYDDASVFEDALPDKIRSIDGRWQGMRDALQRMKTKVARADEQHEDDLALLQEERGKTDRTIAALVQKARGPLEDELSSLRASIECGNQFDNIREQRDNSMMRYEELLAHCDSGLDNVLLRRVKEAQEEQAAQKNANEQLSTFLEQTKNMSKSLISSMKEKADRMESDVKENESLRQRIRALEAEVQDQSQRGDDGIEALEETMKVSQDLMAQTESAKDHAVRMEKERGDLAVQLGELQMQLDENKRVTDQLQRTSTLALGELEEAHKIRDEHNAERAVLETELVSNKGEMEHLRKQMEAKLMTQMAEVRGMQVRQKEQEEQIKFERNRVANTLEQLEETKEAGRELLGKLNDARAANGGQGFRYVSRIAGLETMLKNERDKIATMEPAMVQLAEETAKLRARVEELEGHCTDAKEALEETMTVGASLVKKEGDDKAARDELETLVTELTGALEASKTEVTEMEAKLVREAEALKEVKEAARALLGKYDKSESRANKLSMKLAEAQAVIDKHKDYDANVQLIADMNDALTAAQDGQAKYKEKLAVEMAVLENTKAKINSAKLITDNETASMRSELDRCHKRETEAAKQIKELTDDNKKRESRNKDLQVEVEQLMELKRRAEAGLQAKAIELDILGQREKDSMTLVNTLREDTRKRHARLLELETLAEDAALYKQRYDALHKRSAQDAQMVADFEERMADAKRDLRRAKETVEEQGVKTGKLEKELVQIKDTGRVLLEKYSACKSRVDELESVSKALDAERQASQAKEQRLVALAKQHDDSMQQLDIARPLADRVPGLEMQLTQAMDRAAGADRELEKMRAMSIELDKERAKVVALKEGGRSLLSKYDDAKARVGELEPHCEDLQQELQNEKGRCERTEQASKKAVDTYDTLLADTVDKYERILEKSVENTTVLELEKEEREKENAQLHKRIADLTAKTKLLKEEGKKMTVQFSATSVQLSAAQKKLNQTKDRLGSLDMQLAKAEADEKEAHELMDLATRRMQGLDAQQSQLDMYEASMTEVRAAQHDLESRNAQLEQRVDQSKAREQQVRKAHEDVSRSMREIQSKLADEQLRGEKDAARVHELEEELNSVIGRETSLRAAHEEVVGTMRAMQGKFADAQMRGEKATAHAQEVEEQLHTVIAREVLLREQAEEMSKQLDEATRTARDIRTQFADEQMRAEKLQVQVHLLEEQQKASEILEAEQRRSLEDLGAKCAALMSQSVADVSKAEVLNDQLDRERERIHEVEKDLDSLRVATAGDTEKVRVRDAELERVHEEVVGLRRSQNQAERDMEDMRRELGTLTKVCASEKQNAVDERKRADESFASLEEKEGMYRHECEEKSLLQKAAADEKRILQKAAAEEKLQLQKEVREAMAHLSKEKIRADALQQMTTTQETALKESKTEAGLMEVRLADTSTALERAHAEVALVRAELTKRPSDRAMQHLNTQIGTLKQQMTYAQEQYQDSLGATELADAALLAEKKKFMDQERAARTELQTLQSHLADVERTGRSEALALQTHVTQLEGETAGLKGEVERLEAELRSRSVAAGADVAGATAVQLDLQRARREVDQLRKNHEGSVEQLKRSHMSALEQQQHFASTAATRADADQSALRRRITELEVAVAAARDAASEAATADSMSTAAAQAATQAAQVRVAELTRQLEDERGEAAGASAAASTHATSQAAEIARLRKEVDDSRAAASAAATAAAAAAAVTENGGGAWDTVSKEKKPSPEQERLSTRVTELDREVADLQAQLDATRPVTASMPLHEPDTASTEEVTNLQAQLEDLQRASTAEKAASRKEVALLEKDLSDMTAERDALAEGEVARLQEELDTMRQNMDMQRNLAGTAVNETNRLVEELQQTQGVVRGLEEQVEELQKNVSAGGEGAGGTDTDMHALTSALGKAEADLTAERTRSSDMEAELKRTKEALDEALLNAASEEDHNMMESSMLKINEMTREAQASELKISDLESKIKDAFERDRAFDTAATADLSHKEVKEKANKEIRKLRAEVAEESGRADRAALTLAEAVHSGGNVMRQLEDRDSKIARMTAELEEERSRADRMALVMAQSSMGGKDMMAQLEAQENKAAAAKAKQSKLKKKLKKKDKKLKKAKRSAGGGSSGGGDDDVEEGEDEGDAEEEHGEEEEEEEEEEA